MFRLSLGQLLHRHDGNLQSFCRAGFAAGVTAVSILSLLPGEKLPVLSLSDKLGHFIAYTAVAVFGLLGFRGARASRAVIVGVIALGVAIEIAQSFIPGRSADIVDVVANSLGVFAGAVLARRAMRLRERARASVPPGSPAE